MRLAKKVPFFVLALFFHSTAYSFLVEPSILTLYPEKSAEALLAITNRQGRAIDIELKVVVREIDPQSNTRFKVFADDQFEISPKRFKLNSQRKKTIRIKWRGQPRFLAEKAFRLIASETIEKADIGSQWVHEKFPLKFRHVAAIYVSPLKTRPELVAVKAKAFVSQKKLMVEIENKGTRHQHLHGLSLRIDGLSTARKPITVIMLKEQLRKLDGQNILAQSKRRFLLPWPQQLLLQPNNNLKVQILLSTEASESEPKP